MSRALRRHHEQRMKARFKRTGRASTVDSCKDMDWIQKNAGIYANHGKSCSCHMCGNPRRHFGDRTIQERRYGE